MRSGINPQGVKQQVHVRRRCLHSHRSAMTRILAAIALSLSGLLVAADAHAQYYNPYQKQYNNWNNSNPGYRDGSRDVRRQMEENNPYRDSYREQQRYNRSLFGQ